MNASTDTAQIESKPGILSGFGRRGQNTREVKLELFRPACPRFWRNFRSIRRIVLLLLWNFSAYPILGVLYCLPGGYEKVYPMFYWKISCAL